MYVSNELLMRQYSAFCNNLKNAGGSSSHVWNSKGTGVLDIIMKPYHGQFSTLAFSQATQDLENWQFQEGCDPVPLKGRAPWRDQEQDSASSASRKRPSMADQSPTRHTRSRADWPAQLPTPSPNTSPIPQYGATWMQKYNTAVEQLQRCGTRTVDQQPVFDNTRLEMLSDACKANDLFYIMTHAVFCAWTSGEEALLKPLALTDEHRSGLAILESILGSRRCLTKEVSSMFLHFADPWVSFPSALFPNSLMKSIQGFLSALSTHFNPVRSLLQNRGYPPHPKEVGSWFALPSLVLQRAIYQTYLRDLCPDHQYMRQAMDLFLREILTPAGATSEEQRDQFWRASFYHLKTIQSQTLRNAQHAIRFPQPQTPMAYTQHVPLPQHHHVMSHSVPSTVSPTNAMPVPVDGSGDIARPRPMNQVQNAQSHNIPSSYQFANSIPNAQDHGFPPRSRNPTAMPHGASPPSIFPSQLIQYPAGNVGFTSFQYQHPGLPPGIPGSVLHNPDIRPSAPSTTTAVHTQGQGPRPGTLVSSLPPHTLASHSQGPQRTPPSMARGQSDRFFPATADHRDILQTFAQPAPEHRAIHQAETHSPTYCRNLDSPDGQQFRYYRYVEDIILMPEPINVSSGLMSWTLELAPEVMADKVQKISTIGETGLRRCVVADGSTQLRLKCIKRESSEVADGKNKGKATASPNTWPKCVSVSINDDFGVDFRRKAHYGVDLSTDVSDILHHGPNMVKVAVTFTPQEKNFVYQMAVEVIRIASHEKVSSMPQIISSDQVKASILSAMSRKGQEDDELVIVDPVISIDALDPFTSKLWVTPVRGKTCQHRECFDLEAFLLSRTSRVKGSAMTNPDQWKCPICKTDARPQNLVIDGFLLEVRAQLEAQGLLDTRAILVKEDGSWDAKSEVPLTSSKGSESTAADKADAKASSSPEKMDGAPLTYRRDTVIILDDDDDL